MNKKIFTTMMAVALVVFFAAVTYAGEAKMIASSVTSTLCMNLVDNGNVQLATCDATVGSQKWNIDGKTICSSVTEKENLCMDYDGDTGTDAQDIKVSEKSENKKNQLWAYDSKTHQFKGENEMCLDVDDNPAINSQVKDHNCDDKKQNQKWVVK